METPDEDPAPFTPFPNIPYTSSFEKYMAIVMEIYKLDILVTRSLLSPSELLQLKG